MHWFTPPRIRDSASKGIVVTVLKVGYRLIDDCVFIESRLQRTDSSRSSERSGSLDNSSIANSIASSHESYTNQRRLLAENQITQK
ncbi:hypothetical protein O9929_21200 [Vibrio lentus]|nr:hypothetical protein [Vibrio lentus]